MSAQWVTAVIAGAGLLGNLCWTLVNLRIENRMLTRMDELKQWADDRFEPKNRSIKHWGQVHEA